MEAALQTVERLLRQYGQTYQANFAAISAAAWARDPASAYTLLIADEWWEGGDSIAAVDLALIGGFTTEARHDGQMLRTALLEIVDTLQQSDYGDARIEMIASQFRKWLASGV